MRAILIIAAALAVVSITPAQAIYRTYAQWAGMSAGERAAYIAGSADTIISVSDGDDGTKTSLHYYQCLLRSKITSTQLAENILRFAESRPDLHAGTVQGALLQYLIAACGARPK